MRLISSILSSFLALGALCAASSSTGSKVLVVLEPTLSKADYFTFFSDLEDRGYQLTFRGPKDDKPLLVEYDVPNYDHVIIFAPTTKSFSTDLSPQSLLQLLPKKVNLLIALSTIGTPMHSFATEFGLILPPPETPLFSHFPPRKGPKTTLEIQLPTDSNVINASPRTSPILYSGINFALSTNPMLFPLIPAPPESFATDTTKEDEGEILIEAANKGGEGIWAGSHMSVVAGFQTKSGARVVWAGGAEMFSDKFANGKLENGDKTGNKGAVRDVSKWAFQESNVLRIDDVSHHLVGETAPKETYTTNDNVVYTMSISRFVPSTSSWEPYSGIKDMQLEFTMLDPHIRTALEPVPGKPGEYRTEFRIPDRHGVFKFVVDYRRQGWSTLYSATTVPVVPPRHDGYPRFISAAWPYYVGAISTSLGFVAFSALYLGGAANDKTKKKRQ